MQREQKVFEREFAGRKLVVEVGKLAGQAHGSCTVRYGDTVVLGTAVMAPNVREGIDFFPLQVEYEERLYAAGKIKGSRFIKREGRATDEAVLQARLIDRSIRPLFKHTIRREVQVVVTVLSIDQENAPDVPALLAASIALGISPIPWGGPISAVRVIQKEGTFVVNPTDAERDASDFEVFVSGTADAVVMIEAGAKQVSDATMYAAIEKAQESNAELISFVKKVIAECKVEKFTDPEPSDDEKTQAELIDRKVKEFLATRDITAVFAADKEHMKVKSFELRDELDAILKADSEVSKEARFKAIALYQEALELATRKLVLTTGRRVDGRALDQIRTLTAEVGLLPRTHGSGLFQRGETQVLSIVTLGAPGDEQTLDTMEETGTKRFMHHYNFPPFSVGEVKPMRGPSRRDIGHGALVEKALLPLIPVKESFPYTIRVVSEVLGSNGSSSQASICGSTLALMDAGVPMAAPCAGIAMGLITDPDDKTNYRILTDIQGIEDHAGDMDFKVAGTSTGVTAIQLDIKLGGISLEIVRKTLEGAREARMKILDVIKGIIPSPRAELSEYAPRILSISIPVDKIREVIGSGGKVINEIIETCGVDAIDIDDNGLAAITSHSPEGAKQALAWIQSIIKEIEVGEIYEGKVTQIVTDRNSGEEIGAIVELCKGKDGMIHISQLKYERVERVTDVVNVGDVVKVKVMEVDAARGRISLSRKVLIDPPTGGIAPQDSRYGGPSRSQGRPMHGGNGPRRPFDRRGRS